MRILRFFIMPSPYMTRGIIPAPGEEDSPARVGPTPLTNWGISNFPARGYNNLPSRSYNSKMKS